jgi:hypothetical protein
LEKESPLYSLSSLPVESEIRKYKFVETPVEWEQTRTEGALTPSEQPLRRGVFAALASFFLVPVNMRTVSEVFVSKALVQSTLDRVLQIITEDAGECIRMQLVPRILGVLVGLGNLAK